MEQHARVRVCEKFSAARAPPERAAGCCTLSDFCAVVHMADGEASTSATGGAAPLDGEEILDLTPIGDAALNSNESCSRESATTGGRSHTQINHFCDVGKPPPKSMVEPIPPAAVKELTPCDELKSAANDLFKDKKYSKAMEKYGEALAHPSCTEAVSYTHLTLPTKA